MYSIAYCALKVPKGTRNQKLARGLYYPALYCKPDLQFVYQLIVADELHRTRSGAPKNSEIICDADKKTILHK